MVAKKSKPKHQEKLLEQHIEVPAVNTEEMAFCYGVFQGALRGQLAAPDPLRRGMDFETDFAAICARLMLPAALREFFTVRDGRLSPTDIPFHRACFAVLEHYEDHPDQRALFIRICAFYFFINRHGLKSLGKYTKESDDGPEVVLIHPAVMEAVATAQVSNTLNFERKSFLRRIDRLVREFDADGGS